MASKGNIPDTECFACYEKSGILQGMICFVRKWLLLGANRFVPGGFKKKRMMWNKMNSTHKLEFRAIG